MVRYILKIIMYTGCLAGCLFVFALRHSEPSVGTTWKCLSQGFLLTASFSFPYNDYPVCIHKSERRSQQNKKKMIKRTHVYSLRLLLLLYYYYYYYNSQFTSSRRTACMQPYQTAILLMIIQTHSPPAYYYVFICTVDIDPWYIYT